MLVICSLVWFLGLLSAASGFAADAKRIKVNPPVDIYMSFSRFVLLCVYTHSYMYALVFVQTYSVQIQISIYKIEEEVDLLLK